MQKVQLSMQLIQEVVNYLSGRPFAEVFQLISAIQQEVQQQSSPPQLPAEETQAADEE